MDERMDIKMSGCIGGWMCRQNRRMHGWVEGLGGWVDVLMNGRKHGCMEGRKSRWMNIEKIIGV